MTPEDTAELILDLRAIHNHCSNMKNYPEIAKDAADLIEQQQATIARLSAQALSESEEKTFAEYAWDEACILTIPDKNGMHILNSDVEAIVGQIKQPEKPTFVATTGIITGIPLTGLSEGSEFTVSFSNCPEVSLAKYKVVIGEVIEQNDEQ